MTTIRVNWGRGVGNRCIGVDGCRCCLDIIWCRVGGVLAGDIILWVLRGGVIIVIISLVICITVHSGVSANWRAVVLQLVHFFLSSIVLYLICGLLNFWLCG